MEKDKTIISLQLPDFVIDWLKQKAKEECTSMSYIVRRTLIEKINSSKEERK